MNNTDKTWLQHTIRWMSKHVPPVKDPLLPVVFGTIFMSLAIFVVPKLPQAFTQNEFWQKILTHEVRLYAIIPILTVLAAMMIACALCLYARAIQLFFPDYFHPYDDQHY